MAHIKKSFTGGNDTDPQQEIKKLNGMLIKKNLDKMF